MNSRFLVIFRLCSLAGTNYCNQSEAINFTKKVFKITGSALSRINSVIILGADSMLKSTDSKIQATFSPTWAKNVPRVWPKNTSAFCPSLSRKSGNEKNT